MRSPAPSQPRSTVCLAEEKIDRNCDQLFLQRGNRTKYGYDATGIRVSATTDTLDPSDGTTVQSTERVEFLNDPQNFTGYSQVIRETHTDGSGNHLKTVTYTFGMDEISQTTVTYSNGQPGTPTTLFFAHDGHGSVRALLDAAGAIATVAGVRQLFTYDAYGNAIGFNMSAAATVLLYSGEQFDQHTMMQYLRERPYDFVTGRFPTHDPIFGHLNDPQSFHKYLYTHANPINGIDPSGREFSAIGMTSVSSIGGFLNSLTGESGQFVMSTLHDRQIDWLNINVGIGFAALPFGLKFAQGAFERLFEIVKRTGSVANRALHGFGQLISGFWRAIHLDVVAQEALEAIGMRGQRLREYLAELGDVFVFRGTTQGFPGGKTMQQLGVAPTSIDPARAVTFAIRGASESGVPGILYFGAKADFGDVIQMGQLGTRTIEREVLVPLSPKAFADRARFSVDASTARNALATLGINLPAQINSEPEFRRILQELPEMTPQQIKSFLNAVTGSP